MRHRPAFINGPMKTGTHLLEKLMEAFGFKTTIDELPLHDQKLQDGFFYNLQHMKRGHLGLRFQTFPEFITAFCRSPILFIVRDPRDVAVSMAHYLSQQADYHLLKTSFLKMSPEQRLSTVISGKYPIPIWVNREVLFQGSIRDLFLDYEGWVESPFPNTLMLAFEDLVGAAGGGSDSRQLQSIWTAQLALHVAGKPIAYASALARGSSTFRKGVLGTHTSEFTPKNWAEYRSLSQDFMSTFGYDDESKRESLYPLYREFCGEIEIEKQIPTSPIELIRTQLGFNIVKDGETWMATKHPVGDGNGLNVGRSDLDLLVNKGECFLAMSEEEIKEKIVNFSLEELLATKEQGLFGSLLQRMHYGKKRSKFQLL